MTVQLPERAVPRIEVRPEGEDRAPARRIAVQNRRGSEIDRALRLRLSYPGNGVVVLIASGEIDDVTAPRMAALLWPRLLTGLHEVVLDLTGITFLGVAGLELISAASAYAPYRNVDVVVRSSTVAVARALRAGGLAEAAPVTTTRRPRPPRTRTRRGVVVPEGRPVALCSG